MIRDEFLDADRKQALLRHCPRQALLGERTQLLRRDCWQLEAHPPGRGEKRLSLPAVHREATVALAVALLKSGLTLAAIIFSML